MHNVRDRFRVDRTKLGVSLDRYVLQEFPNRRISESLRLELFVRYFTVDQRDRGDVRQTVVRRFPRLRFPFFRFASDNVD